MPNVTFVNLTKNSYLLRHRSGAIAGHSYGATDLSEAMGIVNACRSVRNRGDDRASPALGFTAKRH
jgi:hypothetical protein